MKEDKFMIDPETIMPIVEKIYNLIDEINCDPLHMLFACYLAAECIGISEHLTEESKDTFEKLAKDLAKKAKFYFNKK